MQKERNKLKICIHIRTRSSLSKQNRHNRVQQRALELNDMLRREKGFIAVNGLDEDSSDEEPFTTAADKSKAGVNVPDAQTKAISKKSKGGSGELFLIKFQISNHDLRHASER